MRSTLRRNSPGSWTTFLSEFLTLWCVLLCCLDQQAQEIVDETAPRMLLRPVFPHEICYRDFLGFIIHLLHDHFRWNSFESFLEATVFLIILNQPPLSLGLFFSWMYLRCLWYAFSSFYDVMNTSFSSLILFFSIIVYFQLQTDNGLSSWIYFGKTFDRMEASVKYKNSLYIHYCTYCTKF